MRITTYQDGVPTYVEIPMQVVDVNYVKNLLREAWLNHELLEETLHNIKNKLDEKVIEFDV